MGIVLSSLGRFDEAVAAYRRALMGDPLNRSIRVQLTHAMQCAGLHRDVVREEDELIELFQGEPQVYVLLARSHARLGDRERSLAYVDIAREFLHSDAMVADVLAMIGEEERARQAILDLAAEGRAAFPTARAALILGDENTGLELLEHLAAETGPGFSTNLFCAPEFRDLAGNHRYDALLESRGIMQH